MDRFTKEFEELNKPTLLFVYEDQHLSRALIEYYKKDFKIIYLSAQHIPISQDENLYMLALSSAYLLEKLIDTIHYAILFNTEKLPTLLSTLEDTFTKDKTKIVIVNSDRETMQVVLHQLNLNTQIVLLGDVISPQINEQSNNISKFVYDALVKKTVKLAENDDTPVQAITFSDMVAGINYCLLGHHSQNHTYNLFYSKPQTLAAAAYILKKIEPDMVINLLQEEPPSHHHYSEQQNSALSLEHYLDGFERSIQKMFENHEFSFQKESNTFPFLKLGTIIKKTRQRKIKFLPQLIIGILFFFIVELACAGLTYFFFNRAVHDIQNGSTGTITQDLQRGEFFLTATKPLLAISSPIISLVKPGSTIPEKIRLANLLNDALQFQHVLNSSFTGIPSISQTSLNTEIATFTYFYLNLEKIGKEDNNSQLLSLLSGNVSTVASLTSIVNDTLGFTTAKKYLILFQNNGELRPTGGFIGSVGELSVDHGIFSNIAIQDVYDLDGQLRAHVEPYYIVRRYLQPHLYLRDSNFDMNFENSASTSALLYQLEGGSQVNGVVAIDFEVLKQIIQVVGPIDLPEENKTIDANSLFRVLENTIQSNAIAGSATKKNILSEVETQIQLKVEQNPSMYIKILGLIPELLSQKHILFAFQNQSIETVFSALDLSDNYNDFRNNPTIIPDLVSVNEANIGVNKANMGITREVTYSATLTAGKPIQSHVAITLHNNLSTAQDYKVYIRVLTPKNSILRSITIDGKPQTIVPAITDYQTYESKNFISPQGLEVDQMDSGANKSFGFITIVSAHSNQTIQVEYQNGTVTPTNSYYTYSLLYFKQPGTESYPLQIHIYNTTGLKAQMPTTIHTLANSDKDVEIPFVQNQ